MAECIIPSFDLIENMEEDDIPDLLFTLEFEKSFDGVGWSFLYKHCNIYVLRICSFLDKNLLYAAVL